MVSWRMCRFDGPDSEASRYQRLLVMSLERSVCMSVVSIHYLQCVHLQSCGPCIPNNRSGLNPV